MLGVKKPEWWATGLTKKFHDTFSLVDTIAPTGQTDTGR